MDRPNWAYLDLGYWGRENKADFPMRLSFNARHPQAFLHEDYPPRKHPIPRDCYDPDGHVVVVGQGQKSCSGIYDEPFLQWDRQAIETAKEMFPDRRVVYRPKPRRPIIPNVECDHSQYISQTLDKASLVVTRHSNVGVDAIIWGVPVYTEDGAARALYGPDWHPEPASAARREKFLNALAWYNWRPSEAAEFWRFVLNRFRMLYGTTSSR